MSRLMRYKFLKNYCVYFKRKSTNIIESKIRADLDKVKLIPLYLDSQATTIMDPRVIDSMIPYYFIRFGNPHSRTHSYGWEAEKAVEDARDNIAKLIGGTRKDIIFTSGATEANNIALKGVIRFGSGEKNHIITSKTEHKCVLESCRILELEGYKVTYLSVSKDGLIDLNELEENITSKTKIVSIMFINNEIGVIQPIREIGKICKKHNVLFHTDAAQAIGKVDIDVNEMNIDLLSISGHKIYGPKGIGALYIRSRPRVRIDPLISGGGQERGIRSGTVPTPLVVGLGEACHIAYEEMKFDYEYITKLSNKFIDDIFKSIPNVIRNGHPDYSYPGCVNLSFYCVEGESLLMALKDIALSSGSACTSASLEPSYVLKATGADEDLAHSSIRFGFGRFTTEDEVNYTVELCEKEVNRLREMSPLWEMYQDGIDLKTIDWNQH